MGSLKHQRALTKMAMPFIEDSLVFRFLDPWKIARVSPIFKDGDKQRLARHSKKVSYYKKMLLAKISILLQDTVIHKKKYLSTRY